MRGYIFVLAFSVAFNFVPAQPAGENSQPFKTATVPGNPASAKIAAPQIQNESKPLDTVRVLYNDGDFENAISILAKVLKDKQLTQYSDSIFACKYLGVMLAANPDTREKGKYYLFRLLKLLPSANLVGMGVSDQIDSIFAKVRVEFSAQQQDDTPKTSPVSKIEVVPTPRSDSAIGPVKKRSWIVWTTVACGGLLAGGGAYWLYENLNGEKTSQPEPVTVQVITPKN